MEGKGEDEKGKKEDGRRTYEVAVGALQQLDQLLHTQKYTHTKGC
jgi:hypothetical protein